MSPAGAGAGTEVGNKASQAVHRAGLCFIEINFIGWLDGCWMDVGWMDVGCWMVGESGIKANSAQFSWSLAELGNILVDFKNYLLELLTSSDQLQL